MDKIQIEESKFRDHAPGVSAHYGLAPKRHLASQRQDPGLHLECESNHRGPPFFGRPLSRLCGVVERRQAGSTLPPKDRIGDRLDSQVIAIQKKAKDTKMLH